MNRYGHLISIPDRTINLSLSSTMQREYAPRMEGYPDMCNLENSCVVGITLSERVQYFTTATDLQMKARERGFYLS